MLGTEDTAASESIVPGSIVPTRRSLRVLFVGKAPLSHVGGAEMSTRHLATALTARGHDVVIVTSTKQRSVRGVFDLAVVKMTARVLRHSDDDCGYLAVRSIRPLETQRRVMHDFNADVVVVTGTDPGFAKAALQNSSNRPSLLYVRVEASAHVVLDAHFDLVVTNSEFMAGVVRDLGAEATFIPSVFPSETYRLTPVRQKVLFVNPIPKKGVEIALALAQLRPDIPFVFNLSWRMEPKALRRLRRAAKGLGNIEIRKATHDPATLFRDCRVLLVPSQWAEAWARVVSEAQISGIPAIASRVGGLPESVGPGGILVDPLDSEEAWLGALSEVWDDPEQYERLSECALVHSQREQISPDAVTERFEDLLRRSIDSHAECS